MYTQCPDCSTAFRVTADVLRQAAGKVRCGGCQNAFNALDFLSENMPSQIGASERRTRTPELTPDEADAGGDLPRAISAEQSAALLKTLDQLAGADIRIEDAGEEWRVLDEGEATPSIDEILDDTETPIDHALSCTPDIVEAAEIFDDSSKDAAVTPVDELRFDDNTPLPDDFDLDDEASFTSGESTHADDVHEQIDLVPDDTPADISLGEPDEWNDLLGEFTELAEDIAAPVGAVSTGDKFVVIDDAPIELATADQALEFTADTAIKDDEEDAILRDDDVKAEPNTGSSILDELAALEKTAALAADTDVDYHTVAHASGQTVSPLSEEELSVNMLVDQELLALAAEDDNGTASTMDLPEADIDQREDSMPGTRPDKHETEQALDFETIVMEGEFVHSAMNSDDVTPDKPPAFDVSHLASNEDESSLPDDRPLRKRMVGGIAALVVLLLVQVVHQSREALATLPVFNDTIGPIYRALGQPLQPNWDVSGWRIEASNGNATTRPGENSEADSEQITITTRIGNNSDRPLPYPVILISLTDRFSETIGHKVLEPAKYLGNDLDPRQKVQPGDAFEAVVTVDSPSAATSGFDVDVCYRATSGQMRCAMDTFR